jgi:hypothetical protein
LLIGYNINPLQTSDKNHLLFFALQRGGFAVVAKHPRGKSLLDGF